MTEVLHLPRKPNGRSYYSSSPLTRSSHSYTSLSTSSGSPFASERSSPPSPPLTQNKLFSSHSLPSSTTTSTYPSYSDLSNPVSLPPTPASSVSFEEKDESREEDIAFPSYDDGVQFYFSEEPLEIPPSPNDDNGTSPTVPEDSNIPDSITSQSPLLTPTVVDDTAVQQAPSRHVDYLSHEWREEDIWSSWRHIVTQRQVYGQKSRLENAIWRQWGKSKDRLPTLSPERLNWLKESDVTWLYGPLQPAKSHPISQSSPNPAAAQLSVNSSFLAKKPILKKRSMSEVMLRRSLSANSLVKQAAASIQAQQTTRSAVLSPSHTRTPMLPADASQFQSIDGNDLDYFSSVSTSDDSSTPAESSRRHIRFDDKVEQCIAVECQHHPDDDEQNDSDSPDSDSSDEGVLTMRRPRRRRPTVGRRSTPQAPSASNKIIEKLPDTTLKYKTESPESSRTSVNIPFLGGWGAPKLAQSPSQETLRPSNPSRNFILPTDGDEDADEDTAWRPSGAYSDRRDSAAAGKAPVEWHDDEPSNMRRTPSGMFMPYDEDEEETAMQLGLFGRVSETINTAKDIAHVIWNVGWRK